MRQRAGRARFWDKEEIDLRIVNDGHEVTFWCGDGREWHQLGIAYCRDGDHHDTIGDFRCLAPAIFVSGEGVVRLDSFRYEPLDLK